MGMFGFDYVGSGPPVFPGPQSMPAEYFDKVGRVVYVWDGASGRWIPGPGTNVTLDGVTASGTTQLNSFQVPGIPTAINVTTVAAGTGIVLFPSWTGAQIAVNNNQGTNALLVYSAVGEFIGAAAAVSASVAANTITIFYCFTQGRWFIK